MHEVFPIASGVVIAVLTLRLVAPRWRPAVMAVLGLVFGFLASLISGELALSWGFVPIDVALVLLAAGATTVALTAWKRRAAWVRVK